MSMCFLIAMAIRWGMFLFEFDVEGAFLLPELDRELYGTVDGRTYRFLRPIYGLKQSAYILNAAFDKEINRLELKASIVDPCFYFRYSRKGRVMLCGHVDDCMGAAKDEAYYKHFIACFMYLASTARRRRARIGETPSQPWRPPQLPAVPVFGAVVHWEYRIASFLLIRSLGTQISAPVNTGPSVFADTGRDTAYPQPADAGSRSASANTERLFCRRSN